MCTSRGLFSILVHGSVCLADQARVKKKLLENCYSRLATARTLYYNIVIPDSF